MALLLVVPLQAGQTPTPGAPADAAGPPPTPAAGAAPPAPGQAKPPATVEALEPRGFTYDSEGRRDPFVSLLGRGGGGKATNGTRPPGLPGLGAAEVALKGTMQSRDGFVGILLGADSKTYIVRAGDRLLDGTVRTITQDAMVILQRVDDPLSREKQREVRKVLRQTDEAK
jgi:Tfp pilus assembly protein PilP